MTLDLQALSDRAEILDLCSRYARALDDKDWDLMRTVFTEDAYADFAMGKVFKGVDEILAACKAVMENLDQTQHFLGNHEIAVDGDRAQGRHRVIGSAFLREAVGAPSLSELGEYVGEYVRTEQGWQISRFEFSVSWCEGNMGILGAAVNALAEL